jgi:hypothetical protein
MFCTHAFGIRNEDLIGLKGSRLLMRRCNQFAWLSGPADRNQQGPLGSAHSNSLV